MRSKIHADETIGWLRFFTITRETDRCPPVQQSNLRTVYGASPGQPDKKGLAHGRCQPGDTGAATDDQVGEPLESKRGTGAAEIFIRFLRW